MSATRPQPKTIVRKVAHRLIARGPREVVDLGISRLREAVSSQETLTFFLRDTSTTSPAREDALFREATYADSASYARDIGTDSAQTFSLRLDEEDCYIVEVGGRIAHATWVTLRPAWVREIQRYFVPPEGDAYIFESFTRPEVRGRGIYPFAIASLAGALGARGLRRMWVGVEAHNPSSVRAVTKAGFEAAFTLSYERRLAHLTVSEPSGPLAGVGREIIVAAGRLG